MRERRILFWNLLATGSLGFIFAALQTGLWPQIFGVWPPPPITTMIVAYYGIYRRPIEGVLLAYLLGMTLSAFTVTSAYLLIPILLTIFLAARAIKSMVFWANASYETLVAGGSVVLFHIAHFGLSWLMESNPISSPSLFQWTGELINAIAFGVPVFSGLRVLDRWMGQATSYGLGDT